MTIKAFIIDIGHGLNGNKFMKPGILCRATLMYIH